MLPGDFIYIISIFRLCQTCWQVQRHEAIIVVVLSLSLCLLFRLWEVVLMLVAAQLEP